MPSYAHKKLIDRIFDIDKTPEDATDYAAWIEAGAHLALLKEDAGEEELVVFASGLFTFVHAAVVHCDKLTPIDQKDLLQWSGGPHTSIASYVCGDGSDCIWIERDIRTSGAKTLESARQLVFLRDFIGWTGNDGVYFEIQQEYAHLTRIHWRPEERAYCRFNDNGDIDHVVSVTSRNDRSDISLVSFDRRRLDQYLAASDSVLVRMFDFTLLRFRELVDWCQGEEEVIDLDEEFFFRQNVISGHAAYTRGIQIIRPMDAPHVVFSSMQADWFGSGDHKYVEFIAHDWRNKRVTKISTDPKATTNYFNASENSLPFEVSPAFFRPEVLAKYKADSEKYTVGSRRIRCRGAWSLEHYDVNEAGQVHAYIYKLRDLPYSEQLYWASFNEAPKSGISERAFVNDIKGQFYQFPDPLEMVLLIVRRWIKEDVPWWKLRDVTLLNQVNSPLTASRDEWAEAFMDLSKLVVEGFDVQAIRAVLSKAQIAFQKEHRSLALIELLLTGRSEDTGPQRLEGLRTVQSIRSKVKGHSAGSEAGELVRTALSEHETFAGHFNHVCEVVADELGRIEAAFVESQD